MALLQENIAISTGFLQQKEKITMKMDNTLLEDVNAQINREFYAAYLYFAMATYFAEINMEGFAKLTKNHAKEELNHAKKLYDYLILRNEKVNLFQIEAPDTDWTNPTDAIQSALDHERFVTGHIHKLYKDAKEKNDFALEVFMQWYVSEQVEEEHLFQSMLDKMNYVQDCSCEIVNIDRELKIQSEYVE